MAEDQLKAVKQILVESTDILSQNLDPCNILRTLMVKGALKSDDVTHIRSLITNTKQVESLLGVLMRKPASAYNVFMEALKEEREDLFNIVKEKESKHHYVKDGKSLIFFSMEFRSIHCMLVALRSLKRKGKTVEIIPLKLLYFKYSNNFH